MSEHVSPVRNHINAFKVSANVSVEWRFRDAPRSRSGRYLGVSAGISMDEQFQRMSPKVFWQVFLTSRAACIMVCISSRLLRHNWACEDTSPGSSLQCWVWLMCKDGGEWDRTLWTKESARLSIQTTPTTYQQLSANTSTPRTGWSGPGALVGPSPGSLQPLGQRGTEANGWGCCGDLLLTGVYSRTL